jgi:hypothetical protein
MDSSQENSKAGPSSRARTAIRTGAPRSELLDGEAVTRQIIEKAKAGVAAAA